MEVRERPADRDERGVGHAAVAHARGERPRLVEAAHLDHVVDRVRVVHGCERDAARHGDDGLDPEVHARGEPAVEPDLLLAHVVPAL